MCMESHAEQYESWKVMRIEDCSQQGTAREALSSELV